MKKILSLTVLFAGISLAVFSQAQKENDKTHKRGREHPRIERKMTHRTPEEIAKAKTEDLDQRLKFTDTQRNEVYAVQLEQAKQTAAHRDEMKALQSKWREERKGSQAKLGEILTPEQQQQLKESYVQRYKDNRKGTKGEFRKRGMIKKKMSDQENAES